LEWQVMVAKDGIHMFNKKFKRIFFVMNK
jgi:hypothetical protein